MGSRGSSLSAVILASAMLSPPAFCAEGPRHVTVRLDFQQTGTESLGGIQGGGRVVISERTGPRSRARVGVESTETRVQQSTGIFTIVQDGGEAFLTVATQVPYSQLNFYQDYATRAGYVAPSVAFREVGTSLKVTATILPGNQVKVRLTPRISYFSADGSGAIEFTEAATELVVPSGQTIALGGATAQMHAVTRQILGVVERQADSEMTLRLTATIR